jgi:hypothetical protein
MLWMLDVGKCPRCPLFPFSLHLTLTFNLKNEKCTSTSKLTVHRGVAVAIAIENHELYYISLLV